MDINELDLRIYKMTERAFQELDIEQFNKDGEGYLQIARAGEEGGVRL